MVGDGDGNTGEGFQIGMNDLDGKTLRDLLDYIESAEFREAAYSFEEKEQAAIEVEKVFYRHASEWVQKPVQPGDPIPVLRGGERVGWMSGTILCPITDPIMRAALAEDYRNLNDARSDLEKISQSLSEIAGAMISLDAGEVAALERPMTLDASDEQPLEAHNRLSGKIIREIGYIRSFTLAAQSIAKTASARISEIDGELAARGVGPGRPRTERYHAVAVELGRLYANVLGERPTYSDGKDGLSGNFTPALRAVFDALGWKKIDLDGPAKSAVQSITERDLGVPKFH